MPKTLMTPREIVGAHSGGRLCARPEFYSGRGATHGDLNSPILELIYKGVKKEIGEAAAKHFVQMVADIDVLSATKFLNIFYAFGDGGWKWKRPQAGAKGNALDHFDFPQGDQERALNGVASIGAWMGGGSDRDDTEYIRGAFLGKHRSEYKAPKGREPLAHGNMWTYYGPDGKR